MTQPEHDPEFFNLPASPIEAVERNRRMADAEQSATIGAALAYCARTDQGDWVISYHEAVQSLCAILSRSTPATEAVRLDPEPATVTFMGQPALNRKFDHATKLPKKGEN